MTPDLNNQPDIKLSIKQTFGIDSNMEVDAFSKKSEYVPEIDKNYKFDRDTTLAIISGFSFNKRVLIQGYHGTGKSTHIEQIAARLNWPCIRVNLDSHISRIDLIGKDAIVLKDELDKEKLKSDFNHMGQFRYDHKDIKAFEILGISVGSKWEKIYDKFKILVKKFHPDMNSGNKKFEEKLKSITLAYTQLKNTYRDKIDNKY